MLSVNSGFLLGCSSGALVCPEAVENLKLLLLRERSVGIDSRSLSDIENLAGKQGVDVTVSVCSTLKGFCLVDACALDKNIGAGESGIGICGFSIV